jgi:hypothetical protein
MKNSLALKNLVAPWIDGHLGYTPKGKTLMVLDEHYKAGKTTSSLSFLHIGSVKRPISLLE